MKTLLLLLLAIPTSADTLNYCAYVENGTVSQVAMVKPGEGQKYGCIESASIVSAGWTYDGNTFAPPAVVVSTFTVAPSTGTK